MILDRVVGASLEHLSDLGPLVVDDAVHQEQDPLFLLVPVDLLDARVEVVVPALAALLAHSAVQVLRDEGPLLRPVGHHKLEDTPVFLRCPGSLDIEWLTLATHSLLWKKACGGLRGRLARTAALLLLGCRGAISCLLARLVLYGVNWSFHQRISAQIKCLFCF